MQMVKGQGLKGNTGSFSLPSSHPLSLPSLSCFLSSFFFHPEIVHLLPSEKAGDIFQAFNDTSGGDLILPWGSFICISA